MHLRKKVISILALVVLGAGVIYGSTFTMKDNPREQETIRFSLFDRQDTIYFWYADESLSNYINSAAVSFGEQEDVHVIPVLTSASEYLEAINRASVSDDQLPDAYVISHDNLEKAYLAGLATQLKDDAGIGDSFSEAALSAVTYKGKQVAYPFFFDTSALVYNEDYLREWAAQSARRELQAVDEEGEGQAVEDQTGQEQNAEAVLDEQLLAEKTESYFQSAIPKTVDDILEIADSFDAPEGVEGVMEWDVSDIFFNYWFVGNYLIVGGEAGDDETNISVNNEETVKCLERYKELNQFFSIDADTVEYENVLQNFIEGKMLFTIATTDAVSRLEVAKNDGTLGFTYGFATMPDVTDELASRSMSVTNAVVVNGYSKHKEIANKFARYLVEECAEGLYEKTGKLSANQKLTNIDDKTKAWLEEYADSMPLPKMMKTGNYWLLLERLFSKVWNGEDVTALVQELDLLLSSQLHEAKQ